MRKFKSSIKTTLCRAVLAAGILASSMPQSVCAAVTVKALTPEEVAPKAKIMTNQTPAGFAKVKVVTYYKDNYRTTGQDADKTQIDPTKRIRYSTDSIKVTVADASDPKPETEETDYSQYAILQRQVEKVREIKRKQAVQREVDAYKKAVEEAARRVELPSDTKINLPTVTSERSSDPQISILQDLYTKLNAVQRKAFMTALAVDSKTTGDGTLTSISGTNYGPSGKETYYNLDMSQVVENMHKLGFEGEYSVRADGVKMFGDKVMVAANLDIYKRGSIISTSLGDGIVVDTGEFVQWYPYQLDIATDWGASMTEASVPELAQEVADSKEAEEDTEEDMETSAVPADTETTAAAAEAAS